MKIIKLKQGENFDRKKKRSRNLKKNKGSYRKLREFMVPNHIDLSTFRKFYHPVLTVEEKEVLLKLGMDPWSIDGLKYVGDCKRLKIELGDKIDKQ